MDIYRASLSGSGRGWGVGVRGEAPDACSHYRLVYYFSVPIKGRLIETGSRLVHTKPNYLGITRMGEGFFSQGGRRGWISINRDDIGVGMTATALALFQCGTICKNLQRFQDFIHFFPCIRSFITRKINMDHENRTGGGKKIID